MEDEPQITQSHALRVQVCQYPYMDTFHNHHVVRITIASTTGNEWENNSVKVDSQNAPSTTSFHFTNVRVDPESILDDNVWGKVSGWSPHSLMLADIASHNPLFSPTLFLLFVTLQNGSTSLSQILQTPLIRSRCPVSPLSTVELRNHFVECACMQSLPWACQDQRLLSGTDVSRRRRPT